MVTETQTVADPEIAIAGFLREMGRQVRLEAQKEDSSENLSRILSDYLGELTARYPPLEELLEETFPSGEIPVTIEVPELYRIEARLKKGLEPEPPEPSGKSLEGFTIKPQKKRPFPRALSLKSAIRDWCIARGVIGPALEREVTSNTEIIGQNWRRVPYIKKRKGEFFVTSNHSLSRLLKHMQNNPATALSDFPKYILEGVDEPESLPPQFSIAEGRATDAMRIYAELTRKGLKISRSMFIWTALNRYKAQQNNDNVLIRADLADRLYQDFDAVAKTQQLYGLAAEVVTEYRTNSVMDPLIYNKERRRRTRVLAESAAKDKRMKDLLIVKDSIPRVPGNVRQYAKALLRHMYETAFTL